MQLLITPSSKADVEESLQNGERSFFVDFEHPPVGEGKSLTPPHNFKNYEELRKEHPAATVIVRPDGEQMKDPSYLEKIVDLRADAIFFPNADDVSKISYFSKKFQEKGAKFIAMIESRVGFEAISEILRVQEVEGLYVGLHDFSKSLGYNHPFDPVEKGYLGKIAKLAHQNKVHFGFTSVSSAFSDTQIFYLMGLHAHLKSSMTLAPIARLKNIQNSNNLQHGLSYLRRAYSNAFNSEKFNYDTLDFK